MQSVHTRNWQQAQALRRFGRYPHLCSSKGSGSAQTCQLACSIKAGQARSRPPPGLRLARSLKASQAVPYATGRPAPGLRGASSGDQLRAQWELPADTQARGAQLSAEARTRSVGMGGAGVKGRTLARGTGRRRHPSREVLAGDPRCTVGAAAPPACKGGPACSTRCQSLPTGSRSLPPHLPPPPDQHWATA